MVSHALGVASNAVTVQVRRMGGGFGGKETQGNQFAAIAAIAAKKLNRAVKIRPDRDDDMIATGKRHDFHCAYDVGFDDEGRILAVDATYAARCGFSADLSGPVTDRALFHADNCYYLPRRPPRLEADEDQHRLEHRLPRLRRTARHGRRREDDRGDRLRARQGPAGNPQDQFLRRGRIRVATSRPITRPSRTTSSPASSRNSKPRPITRRGAGRSSRRTGRAA